MKENHRLSKPLGLFCIVLLKNSLEATCRFPLEIFNYAREVCSSVSCQYSKLF